MVGVRGFGSVTSRMNIKSTSKLNGLGGENQWHENRF